MRYKKAERTYTLEECRLCKIRLFDDDDFAETPWGKISPDGKDYILQNDGLMFLPYRSWGIILPRSSMNPIELIRSGELELHPEAYCQYEKHGIIDTEGNYIVVADEPAA